MDQGAGSDEGDNRLDPKRRAPAVPMPLHRSVSGRGRMTYRAVRGLIAAAFGVGLFLAGCGNGGSSAVGPSSTASTSSPSSTMPTTPQTSPATTAAPSAPSASDVHAASSCGDYNAFERAYGPKSPDPNDPGFQRELSVILAAYRERTGQQVNSLTLFRVFGANTICMQSPTRNFGDVAVEVVSAKGP
jgi:hypothetical protein